MFAKLKTIVIFVAVLFGLGWVGMGAYKHVREQPVLRQNGVEVIGKLKEAEAIEYLSFTIRRKLTVQYLGTYSSDFAVNKEVFQRYVKDNKFVDNTPISVRYLPDDPNTAELSEMLGNTFYLGGPGMDLIAIGVLFIFFVIAIFATLIRGVRDRRQKSEEKIL